MTPFKFKVYAYRHRLVPMFALMMVPWVAVAPWSPLWMLAFSVPLLFVCAWLLFLHVLPNPPTARRGSDSAAVSDLEIAKMRRTTDQNQNAQLLLARVADMTRESKQQLEEVDQHVTEVMSHAESAVIEIGKRFVEVTRKTRQQVELAVGLLSTRGAGGEEGEQRDSLTDYIHASDALLKNLGGQLVSLSDQLATLSARQEAVREESKRIDGALDQLAQLASEIRVLALDSGRRGNADNRAFVEMTDRVRALSLTADDSSRAIRKTLEDIKQQARNTDDAIRAIANQARDVGRKSTDQISQLTGASLKKNEEVHAALEQIGTLGARIQDDINQIIIELQFQDITQQKLQRLKQPMLSELASSWLSMFEETRTFNRRLKPDGDAEPHAAPFRVSLKGGATDERARPAEPAKAPAEAPRRDDGSKVELF